jgi:hypothetical protein
MRLTADFSTLDADLNRTAALTASKVPIRAAVSYTLHALEAPHAAASRIFLGTSHICPLPEWV